MSDHLDEFMKQNRGQFDKSNPGSEVWNNISQGLNNAAAGAGSAGAAGSASSGLAKIATVWKVVGAAAATAITAAGIYFAATSGGGKTTDSEAIAGTNDVPDQKVELIENNAPLVTPPIKSAIIPFAGYTVNGKKGGEIRTETGTIITVPENAFVDADGKPVKGDVNINYREFHDGADLMLSGIPMKFEENGEVYDFQTAGMMEITGTEAQSGEPVYIAQGKEVNISLASFTDEDDYNLYFLDPEQRRWADIGKAEMGENEAKKEGLKLLPKKPKKPGKPVRGKESDNTFDFAVDFKEFPELKPFKKIVWQPTDEAYMEKNEWAYSELWTNVNLKAKDKEKGLYTLELSNSKKKFTTDIVPALDGKDFDKAMAGFNKKMDNYNNMVAQRDQEVERLNAQADVLRTFGIASFGIYNCDRYLRMPNAVRVAASFEFDENFYLKASQTSVFHITGQNRSVIPRTVADDNLTQPLAFSPQDENFLVVVLPGNKLGVFGPEDFRQMDLRQVRKSGKYTFRMRTVDVEIKDAQDIRDALGV